MTPDNPDHTFFLKEIVKQSNNRILCVDSTDLEDPDGPGLLMSFEVDGSINIQFNSGKPVRLFSRSGMSKNPHTITLSAVD